MEIAISPTEPAAETSDVTTHSIEAQALYNRLHKLRKQYADANKVPPYVVFADSSLRLMAQQQPQTLAQFAKISGVGARKLAQYGEMFTAEIRAFRGESGLSVQTESDPTPPLAAHPPSKSDVSQTHLQTLDFYQQGLDITEIAVERRMRETTIIEHLIKLMECSYEVNLDRIVSLDRQGSIEQAINQVGAARLNPIRAHLGDDYSYEEIKLVRAKLKL